MWCLLSLAALAADPDPAPVNPFEEPDESALYRLDEQLVTVASKYAQAVRKAPNIVSLVTAEQIRERGYRTVSDLLRDLPGIYIWKSKEGRDLAAFRGVISEDNNKVLVLIDGVPWYDGVYTHTFIGDYLPISHIKQVEVIKGPGSAIYGTNAFAGVINIVTFGPEMEGARVRTMVGGRARTDVTAVAGARTRVGSLDVEVSGYARMFGQWGDGLDFTPENRRDIRGLDPKSGVFVGTRMDVEGLRLQLHHVDYRHTFLTTEADDPYDLLGKNLDSFGLWYHNTAFTASYGLELGRSVEIRPQFWSQRHDNPGSYWFGLGYDTQEVEDGVFETEEQYITVETEKDTRRWGGSIDTEIRPGIDHILVGGVGIENVGVIELADYELFSGAHQPDPPTFVAPPRSALRNLYAYTQYTWTMLPELEITAGGRLDKRIPSNEGESASDGAFRLFGSPRAGVLLIPNQHLTAKLLYGRAFRSPSVRELLVRAEPDEDGTYEYSSGNLAVQAESIDTAEAEVTANPTEAVEVRVAGSYSMVRNGIDKVSPPNQYQNLPGSLNIVAAEAEVQATADIVTLRLAYALTLARYADDPDNPYAGLVQYEFPPHMAKGNLRVGLTDNLSTTLTGEVYSPRPRSDWSPDAGLRDGETLGLLHFGAQFAELGPKQRFSIGASVRNLTDTEWGTGVYRDEANAVDDGAPEFPLELQGEGRSAHVTLEFML